MAFPLAYTIQPGDVELAASLLADVNATIAANLGASGFYAPCPTATPGAHGILQGEICAPGGAVPHGYAVTRQFSPAVGRRFYFNAGTPLPDPIVPPDADLEADTLIADGLCAGEAGIEAILGATTNAVVVLCPGVTSGALAILLYRGRKAGWNSSMYFPAGGVQRIRYSKS